MTLSDNQQNDSAELVGDISIESASYMEQQNSLDTLSSSKKINSSDESNSEEGHTPQLFSDETDNIRNIQEEENAQEDNQNINDGLLDQDNNEEEDFEIPAFLRRQKF